MVFLPLCLSHQVAQALHQGADDEPPTFHVQQHREDEKLYEVQDPLTVAKQCLSFCSHQDFGGPLVGIAGYFLGGLHLL